ncbi:MAG: amidohydrolase family protein [Armatimonadota bacterium]|nr:amidohydrolase family protein [Armatimonadota bacterium]
MEVRPVDQRVYTEELRPWLPSTVIDAHVHIGLAEHIGPISEERKKENWAYEVGLDQSWEDLWRYLRALFPDLEVRVLAFGIPLREVDLERNNEYVLDGASRFSQYAKALYVSRPDYPASMLESAFSRGFLGVKPYPDLVLSGKEEPGVYDVVPRHHLELVNRRAGIVMLHLPKKGRIADPDNIRDLIDLSHTYPSAKIIVAHVGRSFCLPTAQSALPALVGLPNVWYDIAAVMNPDVIEYAIRTLGLDRVLYGSDLPITLIRGYREHIGEIYINYTDGDYSWNTNRKPPDVEANYTYYLYEELKALIAAARRIGNARAVLRKVMFDNAAELLGWK